MSKFDDDIRRISVLVNDLGDGRDGDAWDRLRVVLGAAGKVDGRLMDFVGSIMHRDGATLEASPVLKESFDSLYALLAALPEDK